MTHCEQIYRAIINIIRSGQQIFQRVNVRDELGLDHDTWMSGYVSIFQGMRDDHPGGAPDVKDELKNVLHRVGRGQYVLTDYGRSIMDQYL